MGQMRGAVFIQILNAFVDGLFIIALPLLMLDRNVDIVTIGLIYASLPMIFQVTRMFFAVLSDFIGRKIFFVLNGILNVSSTFIYYFAFTPLQFLFGKITEGTKDASLWSVNRAFFLEQSEEKRKALIYMRTSSFISNAFGTLIAGFLIVLLSYASTIISCLFAGLLIIPTALLLTEGEGKKFGVKEAFHFLDIRKRGVVFKRALLIFLMMGLSFGYTTGYVLPLFLKENEFEAEIIGILLGIQTLIAGLSTYLFTRKIKLEKLVLYSGFFYSLVLFLLGFSSRVWAAFFIILFGVTTGVVAGGQEGILEKVTREESYGTDIGLLMMGMHGGRTISLALSGFLITSYGFVAPFSLSSLIFVVYFLSAYCTLK